MSYDVARGPILTVLNGQTDSVAVDIHQTIADAILVLLYSPASLNTGVFIIQITPDDIDKSPVWYPSGLSVPAAGTAGSIGAILPAIGFRIHATTPPNADTTFKIAKQFAAYGVLG
jgi:hypothetical protein